MGEFRLEEQILKMVDANSAATKECSLVANEINARNIVIKDRIDRFFIGGIILQEKMIFKDATDKNDIVIIQAQKSDNITYDENGNIIVSKLDLTTTGFMQTYLNATELEQIKQSKLDSKIFLKIVLAANGLGSDTAVKFMVGYQTKFYSNILYPLKGTNNKNYFETTVKTQNESITDNLPATFNRLDVVKVKNTLELEINIEENIIAKNRIVVINLSTTPIIVIGIGFVEKYYGG